MDENGRCRGMIIIPNVNKENSCFDCPVWSLCWDSKPTCWESKSAEDICKDRCPIVEFEGVELFDDDMPTIEAEPKHAYVIVDEDGNMECSNCGSSNCFDDYCGHCGAKLIGTRKDEVEI